MNTLKIIFEEQSVLENIVLLFFAKLKLQLYYYFKFNAKLST